MVNEVVVQEDNGDGNIQCVDHPYKTNAPGGICAFCLQEKLGKLVSSSFPIAVFPSSSSSTSPSFRSAVAGALATAGSSSSTVPVRSVANPSTESRTVQNTNQCQFHQNHQKRSRLAFLLAQKKKKNKDLNTPGGSEQRNIIFKRSKSTATPRRDVHFSVAGTRDDYVSHKRGFWPFLYLTKHSSMRKSDSSVKEICYSSSSTATTVGSSEAASTVGPSNHRSRERKREEFVAVVEENESPNQASFNRKVSRSRSVGCGSRSFSGDFFERISTGFGDCTLRRVESQREGKSKARGGGAVRQDGIKERVKCGGLFSGFMITSSSSSSSSSSNWVSSSTEDNTTGKAPPQMVAGTVAHGRSKSWGWALASPIRAFSRSSGKKRGASNKKSTANLTAIPSLLAVRS